MVNGLYNRIWPVHKLAIVIHETEKFLKREKILLLL